MAVILAPVAGARVVRVGAYKGIPGQFTSIQAAVDAAKPGDWVLVAPGDYLERADHRSHRATCGSRTSATSSAERARRATRSGGTFDQTYASNFNFSDSGYYIGACQQVCNQTIDHAHGEFNSSGYSGSNSGGALVVKNSEWDQNMDGFDSNSQNGDNPPPAAATTRS